MPVLSVNEKLACESFACSRRRCVPEPWPWPWPGPAWQLRLRSAQGSMEAWATPASGNPTPRISTPHPGLSQGYPRDVSTSCLTYV